MKCEMKKILLLIISFLTVTSIAQDIPPKREFRAVWVASVSNIDWPTSKYLTPTQQRSEIVTLLNRHKQNGMNCIVLQIRPSCDAFYNSTIEPWSEWLSGTQGVAPNPLYDPLQFAVEEAHKRGMEVHAWFNPYRAVVNKNTSSVASSHISKTKPEWIREYGNYKWLDPGIPDVWAYDTKVIIDVVKRYDIDGVHFDDYFYPYPIAGTPFPDDATFATYGGGFSNKNDWRRYNVNKLIQMLADSIKYYKPYVKLGMSPFGIWRNSSTDPSGSATSGLQSYDEIFADSKRWVQAGWIDYIAPQIYWPFGYSPAKYEVLVPWWNNNSYGRHFYVGQAAYKITSTSPAGWTDLTQMPSQIRFNREHPNYNGSIFFSSKSITNNLGGFQDSLRNNLYKYPSLIPAMPWKDSVPPLPPVNLSVFGDSNSVILTWEKPLPASDEELPKYFVVYRFKFPDTVNINDPRAIRIITITDTTSFTDQLSGIGSDGYTFAVTSVDRLHNESVPAVVTFNITDINDKFISEIDFSLEQNYPNPFNPITNISYKVAKSGKVTLKVFDVLGNEVITIVEENKLPGTYTVEFDGSNLPSGLYIYRLTTPYFTDSKKMLFLK